ncbi:hypothetical protein FGG08_001883 [Glutinoglossum americanum]|uniref:Pre-rRNA processing protein n=1 Tax=Glutinoglossum americanum TaxID=1670608 RepID=A0A9P8IAB0_9PEZI|nr:hypothetical protein FGG08_001883 [Glutinoglossum americanum]
MSDNPASPLLGSSRPSSMTSSRQNGAPRSTETTPLLSREEDHEQEDGEQFQDGDLSPAASWLRSLQERFRGNTPAKRLDPSRWPSAMALVLLTIVVFVIMALGFFAPAVVERYAKEAAVFEPTKLSIDSFTATGVRARVQGTFVLDASRVETNAVRNLGRMGTWMAGKIATGESKVRVYLSDYEDTLLGTATIPGIVVGVRNGQVTNVDIVAHIEPGEIGGIRTIANDWLEGKLKRLRLQGKADVGLKSGIFSLGTQTVSETLVFEGQNLPAFPKFDVTGLNFTEVSLPEHQRGMAADVSLSLFNVHPVQFTVPPLGFDILVPSCKPTDPHILLAEATTEEVDIKPQAEVQVDVGGIIREIPDVLTKACPGSHSSPLDLLLGDYLHGNEMIIYVRGASSPSPDAPGWVSDVLASVTVPVPFPGHTLGNLIRNFTLANVHFSLPDPEAEPGTPEAQPKLSAIVKALVDLPKEMNFPLNVSRVRANAEVYYHGKKLGHLDLKNWRKANSTRVNPDGSGISELRVEAKVDDAPLHITDGDVFTEVIQALVFGGKGVLLDIKADVDVKVGAAFGKFAIKGIPAKGKVVVKPISKGFGSFPPKVGSLKILDTTESTFTLQAKINFTNPTKYSAVVPYVDLRIINNNTILGHATAKDVSVSPGDNDNIVVEAVWDPMTLGGEKGQGLGREFLSQYISGRNTTLIVKTHNGTFPSQPSLGAALSSLEVELPAPKLSPPKIPNDGDGDGGDDEDDRPHFIKDATVLPTLIEFLREF